MPKASQASARPFDGAAELPEVVGLFGVGEVQAVGDGPVGVAPTQAQVAGGFGDGDLCADIRIEVAVARVAVRRQRQTLVAAVPQAEHGGVGGSGQHGGLGLHHRVVLVVHPALGGDGRRSQQL